MTASITPVLDHPNFTKFPASVGVLKSGKRKHHYFEGGLVVHTAQVLESAYHMGHFHSLDSVTMSMLTIAAIWHDFGKVDEYERLSDGTWERRRPHLGHISAGLFRWGAACKTSSVRDEVKKLTMAPNNKEGRARVDTFMRQVSHMIASHHGMREWGSPDTPQDMAAVLLHQADMQSLVQDDSNPYAR